MATTVRRPLPRRGGGSYLPEGHPLPVIMVVWLIASPELSGLFHELAPVVALFPCAEAAGAPNAVAVTRTVRATADSAAS